MSVRDIVVMTDDEKHEELREAKRLLERLEEEGPNAENDPRNPAFLTWLVFIAKLIIDVVITDGFERCCDVVNTVDWLVEQPVIDFRKDKWSLIVDLDGNGWMKFFRSRPSIMFRIFEKCSDLIQLNVHKRIVERILLNIRDGRIYESAQYASAAINTSFKRVAALLPANLIVVAFQRCKQESSRNTERAHIYINLWQKLYLTLPDYLPHLDSIQGPPDDTYDEKVRAVLYGSLTGEPSQYWHRYSAESFFLTFFLIDRRGILMRYENNERAIIASLDFLNSLKFNDDEEIFFDNSEYVNALFDIYLDVLKYFEGARIQAFEFLGYLSVETLEVFFNDQDMMNELYDVYMEIFDGDDEMLKNTSMALVWKMCEHCVQSRVRVVRRLVRELAYKLRESMTLEHIEVYLNLNLASGSRLYVLTRNEYDFIIEWLNENAPDRKESALQLLESLKEKEIERNKWDGN